jgi:hypothetical protein
LTINSSAAEGTGTTNTLPIWSDGPNGVLSDSGIQEIKNGQGDISNIIISTSEAGNPLNINFGTGGTTSFKIGTTEFIKLTNQVNGFYNPQFRFGARLTVDRSNNSQTPSLDVGDADHTYPAAWFRNGVVISNNPSGVQVDNTSMVIGAGNNDNVSGSDHCLIVGSGNQITSNSDQSVAFGQGNTITGSTDATAAGNQNIITSSSRSLALGSQNQITSATSSFAAGGENVIPNGTTNMLLGYQNTAGSGGDNYILGNVITGTSRAMTIGFRNNTAGYPTPNKNLGLGDTKFVVAVGSGTVTPADNNAIIITEGGVNGGNSGTVPQVPRVILPTVTSFSASNDAAADALGVPQGALYQNQGVVQINRGGGSTTDPLAGGNSNQFPNGLYVGGTTAENLLDDYEEGTYIPSITATGTDTTNFSSIGYYTKIGDIVHVEMRINKFVDEGQSCNVTNITLPFAANNTSTIYYKGGLWYNQISDKSNLFSLLRESTINLTPYNGATNSLSFSPDENNTIGINITYKVQ